MLSYFQVFQQPLFLVTTGIIHFPPPPTYVKLTSSNLLSGVTCCPIIVCLQIEDSLTLWQDWEGEQADMGGERATWVTWTGTWQKQGGGFLDKTMERHLWSNKFQSSSLFPTLSQVITPINFIKVAEGFTNIWEVP